MHVQDAGRHDGLGKAALRGDMSSPLDGAMMTPTAAGERRKSGSGTRRKKAPTLGANAKDFVKMNKSAIADTMKQQQREFKNSQVASANKASV